MNVITQNICIVTVTYGNRKEYLKTLIDHFVNEAKYVTDIVIINNNSTYDINQCISLEVKNLIRIHIINNSENLGSARGFHAGLNFTKTLNVDFIWILDDDNLPQNRSAERLLTLYNLLNYDNSPLAISALRLDRQEYFQAAESLGSLQDSTTSFMGFSILTKAKLFTIKSTSTDINSKNPLHAFKYPLIKIERAPYGGLFFRKRLIDEIGLPCKEMFLYFDDHEYTNRIVKTGGSIYLSSLITITDLEASWDRDKEHGHYLFTPKANEKKIYYSIRNKLYIQFSKTKPGLFFYINMLIYILSSLSINLTKGHAKPNYIKRILLIKKAISDGLNKNLNNSPYENK